MRTWVKEARRGYDWQKLLPDLAAWTLEAGIAIQQIPAPTFAEEARARHVAALFADFGLDEVDIDAQWNAYGYLRGVDNSTTLMVMAHTDTVFDVDTDLSVRHEGERIYGVGLGDNSMGVAGMLALLKFLRDHAVTPPCGIWFVATSCEEGLGDLRGVRAAFARLRERVNAVINIEGSAFGHVYHAGIGVHRLHITATTEGGHSWLHFGRPSATHAVVQLGARITQLKTPSSPRTTYNIGMIEGGQAINAIATSAGFWLDMRSESQHELDFLVAQVQQLLKEAEEAGVTWHAEPVGERPTGYLDPRHPLVQGAMAALEEVGVRGKLERASTDGNIPLYYGCPCVTIGITSGGNAHRLDEYIETEPIASGVQQLILLALAAVEHATHKADAK